ncbi:hypothetical protein N9L02_00180 [Gammaproteobacteria bacterium]|nr:hypothetical protein [Gammaproteobacteria bacterium]
MNKSLLKILVILMLLFSKIAVASLSGNFFNVISQGSTLTITTTVPNHHYPNAGIKINTPGYILTNSGSECIMSNSGYCLFPINNSTYKTINITGPLGTISIALCLDGIGPSTCQNYAVLIGLLT